MADSKISALPTAVPETGDFAPFVRDGTTSKFALTKHKLDATVDPTVNDDSGDGYGPTSVWVNATDDKVFICADAAAGAAVWRQVAGSAGGDTVTTGTWSAVIEGATTPGSITYTINEARYMRVGNIMIISAYIVTSSGYAGGAGQLRITGLPEPKIADSRYWAACWTSSVAFATSRIPFVSFWTSAEADYLVITETWASTNAGSMDVTDVAIGDQYGFTLAYEVAP